MKNIFNIIVLFTGSILLHFCSPKKEHSEKIETDSVVSAPLSLKGGSIFEQVTKKNSLYSCYIPESFTEGKKYPAIVFLDPHAKGRLPLEKYKGLAEKFQFILIGSGSTKNGMDMNQSVQIVIDLMNEAHTILPGLEKQITIAGFSGGAKTALMSSTAIGGLNSVIYCGAAFPPGSIKINTPCMGIAGRYDMNFTEVRNFNYSLSVKETFHTLVEWKGKHEWPDSAAFLHAFYWNIFSSMKNNVIPTDEKMIQDFLTEFKPLIEREKNLLVKSELMREEIEMLTGIYSITGLKHSLSELNNSPSYKNAKKTEDLILSDEDKRKKEFVSSFETRELSWWQNEVEKLNADKNNESNQRILGYISLASWSYSANALATNNNVFAQKALQIYKIADPENSAQPYLLACLYAKNGMSDSAVYFINEAIRLGFDDRRKAENEKDLYSLHGRSDYVEALGKMRSY